jgi:molybdopterin-guanine dinucleotide biosynthesis protein A
MSDQEYIVLGGLLAGGQSRRMHANKAAAALADGRRLSDLPIAALRATCDDVVILGHGEGCDASLERVADAEPGGGPVTGLLSLARADHARHFVVIACDMPYVRPDDLRALLSAAWDGGAAIFASREGEKIQPLPCVFHEDQVAKLIELAEAGERRLARVIEALDPVRVPVPDERTRVFESINTPEQLGALSAELL